MALDIEKIKAETSEHLSRNKIILLMTFVVATLGFFTIYSFAPELTQIEQQTLYRLPANPRMLYQSTLVIQKYAEKNFWYVVFALSYLYILLQSFSIPGPPFINILSGAMFGLYKGFLLVTVCSTVGSIICFIIFETVGKGIAIRLFPGKILYMHEKIEENKQRLFFYLLSLRVTPFIPKWISMISSPIIGVPLPTFALSAFFGLMPHNLIHLNAGVAIGSMKEFGLTKEDILFLLGLGVLSFLPTLLIKKTKIE